MEDIPSSTAVVKQCEYKERRENKSYMPAQTRWTVFPEASELSFWGGCLPILAACVRLGRSIINSCPHLPLMFLQSQVEQFD